MKTIILILVLFLTAAKGLAAVDRNDNEDLGATAICRDCLYKHERAAAQMLHSESREDRAETLLSDDAGGITPGQQNSEVSEGAGG